MEKSLVVYRNEKKYTLPHMDSLRLQQEMQILLQPDSYSTDGAYQVRSLYFDSLSNNDYAEKGEGVQFRKKIRLRIYDTSDEKVKLEIKEKNGNYQHKSTLIVNRVDASSMQNGDYSCLLNYPDEIALKIYTKLTLGCYLPVALIEYDRRAFVYSENNTRITFDSHIKTSEMELNLFERNIPWVTLPQDTAILEVKYDERLYHPISKVLEKYRLNQVAYSKYGNGRPLMEAYII